MSIEVTDPFWATVRERRPDVDIIILPPVKPLDPQPEASQEEIATSARIVEATVAAIAARLSGSLIDGPAWEPYGDDLARRRAQITAQTTEGASILASLDQEFRDAKWHSRLAVKAYHRWTASQPHAEIVATWSERHNGLTITVSGRLLKADPETVEAAE
jgi:hypothetical protein